MNATDMLLTATHGDASAASQLMPLVMEELRRLAAHLLRQEREAHTLQPTALVHEAYLRLIDVDRVTASDREQFMRLAARAMRRVLVDHARERKRLKRGGGRNRVAITDVAETTQSGQVDLLALDDAIERLRARKARLAEVIELRFFGGLSIDQTARLLGVSDTTVDADWSFARAWLARELTDEPLP